MATYNGEKFIRQQIDSIMDNTCNDFHLYIFDDCSSDDTSNIITEYASRFPQKIFATVFSEPSGCAKNNFFRGMMSVPETYEHYMLCDQDDVWLPDKISKTLSAMKAAQMENPHIPILVHTDLCVVDTHLSTIASSMAAYQKISHHRTSLANILVQNTVTGCTTMMNKELFEMGKNPPNRCPMHDWWISLIAAAFGKIVYVPTATILYRQHSDNSVGAKKAKGIKFYLGKLRDRKNVKSNYRDTFSQAKSLLDMFGDRLCKGDREMLRDYAQVQSLGKLRKIAVLRKYRLYKNTVQRTVGQFISI